MQRAHETSSCSARRMDDLSRTAQVVRATTRRAGRDALQADLPTVGNASRATKWRMIGEIPSKLVNRRDHGRAACPRIGDSNRLRGPATETEKPPMRRRRGLSWFGTRRRPRRSPSIGTVLGPAGEGTAAGDRAIPHEEQVIADRTREAARGGGADGQVDLASLPVSGRRHPEVGQIGLDHRDTRLGPPWGHSGGRTLWPR